MLSIAVEFANNPLSYLPGRAFDLVYLWFSTFLDVMSLIWIATVLTVFPGCHLTSEIEVGPFNFETGVKESNEGDSVSLFAVCVRTKLNFSGDAHASFTFYMSPIGQLNPIRNVFKRA